MACKGSVAELGRAYQRLVSARDQSRPSIAHLALEYINGAGLEARKAFILRKPTFSLYLPPLFLTPSLVHPTPTVSPLLLSATPLTPSSNPTSYPVLRLHSPLPPPLQKEAFLSVTRTQSCMDRDHIATYNTTYAVCVSVCVCD